MKKKGHLLDQIIPRRNNLWEALNELVYFCEDNKTLLAEGGEQLEQCLEAARMALYHCKKHKFNTVHSMGHDAFVARCDKCQFETIFIARDAQ